MSIRIETGRMGGRWRAAAVADGELIAEAWGASEAEARSALNERLDLGKGHADPGAPAQGSTEVAIVATAEASLSHAIKALFGSHPGMAPHDRCTPETKYMRRYRTANGRSIAHEYTLEIQHIWVAAGSLRGLEDILSRFYPGGGNGAGRHSNLKAIPDLRNADLIRYSPVDAAQAGRILDAVAGLPPLTDA